MISNALAPKELGDTLKKGRRSKQCQFSNTTLDKDPVEQATQSRGFTTFTMSKGHSLVAVEQKKKYVPVKNIDLAGSNIVRDQQSKTQTPKATSQGR